MRASSVRRRLIATFVTASYLLAATFSAALHNHGDGCCGDRDRTRSGHDPDSSQRGPDSLPRRAVNHERVSCRGGHSHSCHSHTAHRHDAAGGQVQAPQKAPHRTPKPVQPLRHSKCAACQFLAEQSLMAPQITLEAMETVAPHAPHSFALTVTAPVADAHLPRGPPACA